MKNWPRMRPYPLWLTGLPVICSPRTPSTRQCILCGLRKDFAKVSREILASQGVNVGVDPCKSEQVTDEDPISLRVGAVENDVRSVDHVSLSLSWYRPFRFVILCPPLRASGQHPRMVKRPAVGTNRDSHPSRARPCSEIPLSLQRHPTACTSRLQEKVDLLSSQVGVQASVALTVCPLTNSSLLPFLTSQVLLF